MRLLVAIGLVFVVLSLVDAQQQEVERTTGNDVTEEEPHPYTISFFTFPRQQIIDLPQLKKHSALPHKANKNISQADHAASGDSAPSDDMDTSFQHGSIKHPAHEMYPTCHHCAKNSTYQECVNKRTAVKCDKGLSNICFTRSTKRGNIMHYEMGCATHRQCKRARSTPCRPHTKHCFTCCQWSRCNSQPHHGNQDDIAYSMWSKGHVTAATGWTLVVSSLLPVVCMYLL